MSLERLQCTYTADERRAIYDAVVKTKPVSLDPIDLALLNEDGSKAMGDKRKSRLELEAELRDMKRRRVRYRGACPDNNYSHVLRGVIEMQMETLTKVIKKEDEIIERKPKYKREDKFEAEKPNRPTNKEFRFDGAVTSKQHSYDNLNSTHDQERKRKHESGYHKEEKHRRFNSKDYDNRNYSNRSEKYEYDSFKTSKDLQPLNSRYSERSSKYEHSRKSYDAHNKIKPHKDKHGKRRHQERDPKDRERHSYTNKHMKRRE